jgi:alpha-ketoglutarate-dependent taurine dioxygenase
VATRSDHVKRSVLRIRRFMTLTAFPLELREPLDRDGYCLIHDVDSKDLLHWASIVGRPQQDPRDRVLVKDIRPQPEMVANPNTLSSRYGMGAFPFHTEAAYISRPPKYLLLYCVNPGIGGRNTIVLDSAHLLRQVANRRRLGTWVVKAGRRPFLCYALQGGPTDFGIRYDRECVFPRGAIARSEERSIQEFVLGSTPTTIRWATRQLLILDNHRMLHGRGESTSDDRDRWLKRVLVADGGSNDLGH